MPLWPARQQLVFEILEHLPLTWDGSLNILRGHRLDFTNNDVYLSLSPRFFKKAKGIL